MYISETNAKNYQGSTAQSFDVVSPGPLGLVHYCLCTLIHQILSPRWRYRNSTKLLLRNRLANHLCYNDFARNRLVQNQIFKKSDFQTLASSLFNLFITNDIYKQQLKLWTKKKEKVKESSWGDQVPKAGEVQGRANSFSVIRFLVRFVTSFRPGLKT